MEKIYTDLALDFRDGRSLTVAHVTQGDKSGGRILRIALYNNGQRVNLNSETDTASLLASVGNIITEAGVSCAITDNTVRVPILDNLTQLSGREHCTIRLESTNGRVHTARFDLLVEKSPISADMPEIVVTADLVDRVDSIETESHSFVKNYIVSSFRSVHPEYTVHYSLAADVYDDGGDYYSLIPKSNFNPDIDGTMIWAGLYLLVTGAISMYTFDTESDVDNVIVNYAASANQYLEENQMKAEIIVFEKPPDSGGETAVVNGYLPDHRYFITPILFDGTGLTSYEICICFRATVHPTRANAFCGGEHDFYRCPSCEMNREGVWQGFAYSGVSPWQYNEFVQWTDMPVTIDFTGAMQWIKLSWDSTEQKQVLSHSLDGLTFTEISSVATPPTAFIPSGNADKIVLGNVSVITADHPFEVGNDINIFNSYIKMNGTLVFGREVTA